MDTVIAVDNETISIPLKVLDDAGKLVQYPQPAVRLGSQVAYLCVCAVAIRLYDRRQLGYCQG